MGDENGNRTVRLRVQVFEYLRMPEGRVGHPKVTEMFTDMELMIEKLGNYDGYKYEQDFLRYLEVLRLVCANAENTDSEVIYERLTPMLCGLAVKPRLDESSFFKCLMESWFAVVKSFPDEVKDFMTMNTCPAEFNSLGQLVRTAHTVYAQYKALDLLCLYVRHSENKITEAWLKKSLGGNNLDDLIKASICDSHWNKLDFLYFLNNILAKEDDRIYAEKLENVILGNVMLRDTGYHESSIFFNVIAQSVQLWLPNTIDSVIRIEKSNLISVGVKYNGANCVTNMVFLLNGPPEFESNTDSVSELIIEDGDRIEINLSAGIYRTKLLLLLRKIFGSIPMSCNESNFDTSDDSGTEDNVQCLDGTGHDNEPIDVSLKPGLSLLEELSQRASPEIVSPTVDISDQLSDIVEIALGENATSPPQELERTHRDPEESQYQIEMPKNKVELKRTQQKIQHQNDVPTKKKRSIPVSSSNVLEAAKSKRSYKQRKTVSNPVSGPIKKKPKKLFNPETQMDDNPSEDDKSSQYDFYDGLTTSSYSSSVNKNLTAQNQRIFQNLNKINKHVGRNLDDRVTYSYRKELSSISRKADTTVVEMRSLVHDISGEVVNHPPDSSQDKSSNCQNCTSNRSYCVEVLKECRDNINAAISHLK